MGLGKTQSAYGQRCTRSHRSPSSNTTYRDRCLTPPFIPHRRVRIWRWKAFAEAIAFVSPEPIHQQMRQRVTFYRVIVRMDDPVSKLNLRRIFKPFNIVPVAALKVDDFINASGVFISAANDIVARCVWGFCAHMCHKFLMVHAKQDSILRCYPAMRT